MLKFAMLLQAVDRVSAPARRIQASMKGIGASARQMAGDVRKVGAQAAQVSRLERASARLKASFAAAGRAAKHWAGKAGIGSWGDAAEKAGVGVGMLARRMGGMALGAAKWAAGGAAAAGGFALLDLFRTASQFEQYRIMLENMEGSAAAAKTSFAWVREFAAKTPYELAEVMEAFVRMKAYGIDPMNGSLRALGDAASGMSEPIGQAVEAMADAITGEFERLKAFGVRTSKQGEQVTFTYRKAGQDIRRTVRATGTDIEAALTGIFSDRFGGMMARQSTTMAGMISNLKGEWSTFLMMVAEAGIFDLVKNRISRLLAKVNELARNGELKRWAETISTWLEDAFKWADRFVRETDWKAVGADIKTVAGAVVILATGLKNAYGWGVLLGRGIGLLTGEGGAERAINGALWGGNAKPAMSETSKRWRAQQTLPGWFGRSGQGGGAPGRAAAPQAPALYRRALPSRKTATADVTVGGRAVVDVRVHGPASATVRQASSAGSAVPMVVNVGRSMGAAA